MALAVPDSKIVDSRRAYRISRRLPATDRHLPEHFIDEKFFASFFQKRSAFFLNLDALTNVPG
jgi:hypothetical protein